MSYSDKYKIIETDYPEILLNLSNNIVMEKIAKSFSINDLIDTNAQLFKALEIIEFKIIEFWNDNDNDFIEYCANYIDIALLLPVPDNTYERIYWILKIISFGYLGEEWQKVRKFLIDFEELLIFSTEAEDWNSKLFLNIYHAIFYIIRKKSWRDLENSISIVNILREEQIKFENSFLSSIQDDVEKKSTALDIASLYHLAKAVEIIARFQHEGNPNDIKEQIEYHFDYSQKYCEQSFNTEFSLLLQYLRPTFLKLASNSIWTVAKGLNSRVTSFVKSITKSVNPVFELLYPQKEAILRQGLLHDANKAVVVNLPTSSGKTLIAEFRILKALNQYSDEKGWVVYTVPTRALVNQIHIRLQKDLSQYPLSLKVEKMSGALELDSFEDDLINENSDFDIIVTTYEKLSLLIRQGLEDKIGRPLSLVVVDEAHNIESAERGIGLELMLSTIKKDCKNANYLLLTPEIPNADDIAKWLDENSTSISVSLNWKPNERMIGEIFSEGSGRNVKTFFKPYLTTKHTLEIDYKIPLEIYENNSPFTSSKIKNSKCLLTSVVSSDFKAEEGILVIVRNPGETYTVANNIYKLLSDDFFSTCEEVELVKKFIASELGEDFQLVKFLDKGIGVHHAALPDDIRFLLENLMEAGYLKYLVCTTTIAQGINFPVSAIFMSSYAYPYTSAMPTKDFWNLAGRAGRMGQKSIGIVGIAVKDDDGRDFLRKYLQQAADDLVSVLVSMVNDLDELGDELDLGKLHYKPEWSNFLQYISHLYKQARDLEEFLSEVELTLRRTYGYNKLNQNKKILLTESVKKYARSINKGLATLSDSTGFSTETIKRTIMQLKDIDIKQESWMHNNLFSQKNGTLQKLVGIMLKTPEIKKQLEEIGSTGASFNYSSIANIITDWVSGKDIKYIAESYFGGSEEKNITQCTRAIYSKIINSATWGLAAMQQIPNSGIDWNNLTDVEKRQFKNLPSMIYYGVNSEQAVLLRKNNVPRTVANNLGEELKIHFGQDALRKKQSELVDWLKQLPTNKWHAAIPKNKKINGEEYKKIWEKLVGIN